MILFNKFRKALLTIALAVFMLMGSAWGVSSSTLAASGEIAATTTMSGNPTNEGIGKMEGNSKEKAAVKAEVYDAKTKEALKNSIGNPKYVPGGNDKDSEIKSRKSAREMKSEALDAFE